MDKETNGASGTSGGIRLEPVGSHETNPFSKTQEEIDDPYYLIADALLALLNKYTDHIEWETVKTAHLDWWYHIFFQARVGDFFEKVVMTEIDLGEDLLLVEEATDIIDHVVGAMRNGFYSQAYNDMLANKYRKGG